MMQINGSKLSDLGKFNDHFILRGSQCRNMLPCKYDFISNGCSINFDTYVMFYFVHFKHRQTENVLVYERIGKCTKANYY